MAKEEVPLNRALARLLGGEAEVWVTDRYGNRRKIDVRTRRSVLECSRESADDAIKDARDRVQQGLATWGNVVAVLYHAGADSDYLNSQSAIDWWFFNRDGSARIGAASGTVALLRNQVG